MLIVLIGLVSFGLGRQSVLERAQPQPTPQLQLEAAAARTDEFPNGPAAVPVVASESGAKYHLPWCPSADRITPENRVEFTSAAEAEAAGYEPAANCPGL